MSRFPNNIEDNPKPKTMKHLSWKWTNDYPCSGVRKDIGTSTSVKATRDKNLDIRNFTAQCLL